LDQAWAEVLPELGRLFKQVTDQYSHLKGQGQNLDYDDLESGALKVLRHFSEVQVRWQREISAILVDEFQDTNSRQRDLVNLIAGRAGKLFIVGDAKQSIYRFRGAEVAVFRAERSRIDHGSGVAFELSTSYRAHRGLLAGLNGLLKPVLGEVDDPDRPWREPFSSLFHDREKPREGIVAPFIELHLTIGSKSAGALDRAAEALAGHLIELVNKDGSTIGFGGIAILCRASTSFAAYETALDKAGIPYLTVAGRGFYDRPEIRDILNMLQAVTDPTDDLALTGLLRSPVVGFSDFALYQLFEEWNQTKREGPLWHFLQQSTDKRAKRIAEIVRDLHHRAGRISVATVLEEFVSRTDYRAALLKSGNSRSARNVSKLLVDAHNSGLVGIGEFLTYVQGLRSGPAREGEAPATAGDVVRIMTIHAAKGLEFPVVVIGDINYQRRSTTDLLLDPELGVFPSLTDDDGAVSGMFLLLQKTEQDQEDAESDRLLYVAATRAQEKLILSGCFNLTQSNRPGWLKGWLKKLSTHLDFDAQEIAYDDDGLQVRQLTLKAGKTEVGCLIYEPKYEPFRLPFKAKDELEDLGIWSTSLVEPYPLDATDSDKTRREPERAWYIFAGERRRQVLGRMVGTLVHEALAFWRFPGTGFKEWIMARARSNGLTDEKEIEEATSRVEILLTRFQADDLFEVMDSADRRLAEVPYDRDGDNGQPEHGSIDALYLIDGTWTLVDYKTDELKDEAQYHRRLKGSPDDEGYDTQVERYASAVKEFTGKRPRTILCFLDYRGEILRRADPERT
jgi:ATP-dependent exoDNAse (exonuclease V) beta subunit